MIELKELSATKLDNGIEVKPYLTYDEIQTIVNQVMKSDEWAEREGTIDILLIKFATNVSDADSEKIGHDMFVKSGAMKHIRNNIKNLNQVYEAIAYTESTGRALDRLAKEVLPLIEKVEKLASKK